MQGSLEVEVMDEPDWTGPTLEDVFGDLHDLDGSIQFDEEDDIPDESDSWMRLDEGTGMEIVQEDIGGQDVLPPSSGICISAPSASDGVREADNTSEKRSSSDWTLTQFAMDPDSQFWLPHLGKAQRQFMPKQPWELSPVSRVFEARWAQQPKFHKCGMAEAVMGVCSKPQTEQSSSSATSPPEFIARRLRFASLSRDEDVVRRKCLQKLRSLILLDPPATQLGGSLVDAAGSLVEEEEVTQSFKDAFAGKATSTLEKRLAALWPYAKWSLMTNRTPMNMDEAKIYEYLSWTRSNGCSASAPSSFLEAVGFIHNIVDVKSLKGAASFSGRCKGLAKDHLSTRAKRKQAPPLSVEMVAALESYVGENFRSHKAVVVGHILFCIYSCARWADSVRLIEINEYHRGRIYIIETATEHHKTAITDEARALFLPYLCLGAGLVEGHPWSLGWMAARQIFKVGRPHTWAAITSWSDKTRKFTSTPMSSTESTLWLREVLEEVGFKPEDTARVSSHSLKSTLLSWAAKSGKFSDPQRRQMGHHYDPQDKSMLVYSRDSYAPIAVAVRLMLDDITAGRFNPDLPRIERIAKAVEMAEEKGGSSSSDSSSSDEIAANSPSTKLANPNFITLDRHPDLPNVPSSFVMVHRLSGVLHISAADGVFACGRRITSSFVEWSSDRFETVDTDVCTQCKAKAPLHFMEEASDQHEPSIGGLSDL